MSNAKESTQRTLLVAFLICLVCSVLVAGVAITLRPIQAENRVLDTQRSIVRIAGLEKPGMTNADVGALFEKRIEARLVDLQEASFSDAFDPTKFNGAAAAKDPALSRALTSAEDIATIRRLERYSTIYLVKNDQGAMESLILPVRGYGLWGTMFGFIALAADLNTVIGFGFYAHTETPGLGGEVDNPRWIAKWPGKEVYNDDRSEVLLSVVKAASNNDEATAKYKVDGLAGATLTSNGVNNLIHFWLGDLAFGPFIAKLRAGEI